MRSATELSPISRASLGWTRATRAANRPENIAGALCVGIREAGAGHWLDALMIEAAGMAGDAVDQGAQAEGARKLAVERRGELGFGGEPPDALVNLVGFDLAIEHAPRARCPESCGRGYYYDARRWFPFVSWSVGKRPEPSRINAERFVALCTVKISQTGVRRQAEPVTSGTN